MPRLSTILSFVLAFLGSRAIAAHNDSYFIPSQDGSRLFVMRPSLHDRRIYPDAREGPYVLSDGRTVDVATTFPMSGLYDVATLKPLWTWDGYAYQYYFVISDDLSSFAVVQSWALIRNDEALMFFHEGKQVASYRAHELVRAFRTEPYLESGRDDFVYFPVWYDEMKVEGQSLALTTMPRRYLPFYRESYRFDLATGKMTEAHVPSLWLMFGLPALLFVATVIWLIRRARHRRGIGIKPGAP